MAYTQAGNKAVQKYNKKAYDDLRIRVKKGEGDNIKAHAVKQGESVNAFVVRAIDETMQRDCSGTVKEPGDLLEYRPGTAESSGGEA